MKTLKDYNLDFELVSILANCVVEHIDYIDQAIISAKEDVDEMINKLKEDIKMPESIARGIAEMTHERVKKGSIEFKERKKYQELNKLRHILFEMKLDLSTVKENEHNREANVSSNNRE